MKSNDTPVLNPIARINNQQLSFFERAKGIEIFDDKNNGYIDGTSSLWCMNLGYGRDEIGKIMSETVSNLGGYFQTFSGSTHKTQVKLAQKLIEKTKKSNLNIKKIFFGLTGSDANDTQIKIALFYHFIRGNKKKNKTIKCKGAYHGCSFLTSSLSGIDRYKSKFNLSQDRVIEIDYPNYLQNNSKFYDENQYVNYLCDQLQEVIDYHGSENIASLIIEPIAGVGGVVIPPQSYFKRIKTILEKNDILLLFDEVICGFGRCGKWFASEIYEITPDLISVAKGITSAYFPLSAVMLSDKVYDSIVEYSRDDNIFCHGFTYSGHPVGCAVALKTIEIIDREGLVENSHLMGTYLRKYLKQVASNYSDIVDIRGEGLLCGVEYKSADTTLYQKILSECKKNGLLLRNLPYLPVTAFAPPLIVNKEQINQIVGIYKKSLHHILKGQ